MPILSTENLCYLYSPNTPFEIAAINKVNVSFEKGDFIGIIGHTGSGKSTLIQHFNGLLKPTSGKVYLNGVDIWSDKVKIRDVRFKVGLCFQYPEYQLFEDTVYKDISFGPKNMGLDEEEIDSRVRRAAEYVGLQKELLPKSPFDLSGGEKRRAAIAGVMAMDPEILILDEPTAGLDPRGKDIVLKMLRDFQRQTGRTVIIVSHSMEDVAKIAEKVLVMNHSNVQMFGTVDEVFSHGEELMKMGLDVPQVTRIFMGLRKKGIGVKPNVYTLDSAKREIMRLISEKKKGTGKDD